jgi:hypothetical protein
VVTDNRHAHTSSQTVRGAIGRYPGTIVCQVLGNDCQVLGNDWWALDDRMHLGECPWLVATRLYSCSGASSQRLPGLWGLVIDLAGSRVACDREAQVRADTMPMPVAPSTSTLPMPSSKRPRQCPVSEALHVQVQTRQTHANRVVLVRLRQRGGW